VTPGGEGGRPAIRVAIVDDHEMVRRGLLALLEIADDLEPVGQASSGEEAIELCEAEHPDIVLMDMMLPGMDGAAATRAIRERCPATQVVVLTSFPEEDLVQKAIDAGALGYLLKNVGAADLAKAIRAAAAGQPTLAPEAAQALVSRAVRPTRPAHNLSARERDVLRLMVQGLSNRAIGEKLSITASTVEFHVSNILAKLGAAGRTEAVAMAVQQKLVE
jgi:NarL family two-component system response regulator LiaR